MSAWLSRKAETFGPASVIAHIQSEAGVPLRGGRPRQRRKVCLVVVGAEAVHEQKRGGPRVRRRPVEDAVEQDAIARVQFDLLNRTRSLRSRGRQWRRAQRQLL